MLALVMAVDEIDHPSDLPFMKMEMKRQQMVD